MNGKVTDPLGTGQSLSLSRSQAFSADELGRLPPRSCILPDVRACEMLRPAPKTSAPNLEAKENMVHLARHRHSDNYAYGSEGTFYLK
jgi:hypothetical protein